MREPGPAYEDPRPIKSIWFDEARHIECGFGSPPVQAIMAYREPGLAADISFLAVYRGGRITDRIPAWKVRIRYV